jgi:hypothetical protein
MGTRSLSTGQIAGIVVGAVVAAEILYLLFFRYVRQGRSLGERYHTPLAAPGFEFGTTSPISQVEPGSVIPWWQVDPDTTFSVAPGVQGITTPPVSPVQPSFVNPWQVEYGPNPVMHQWPSGVPTPRLDAGIGKNRSEPSTASAAATSPGTIDDTEGPNDTLEPLDDLAQTSSAISALAMTCDQCGKAFNDKSKLK